MGKKSAGRRDLLSLRKEELVEAIKGMGEPRFRGGQIFRWLYGKGARQFSEMTDLPQSLRERLAEAFTIGAIEPVETKVSKADGTIKYLFRLEDGNLIETAYIPASSRATVCLSTQVGCKFGCRFCASARAGFVRSLTASEICDQVRYTRYRARLSATNVVFMGIGEPFDNYDAVLTAVRIINDPDGLAVGARKITISTCGVIPGITRLRDEGLQVELSVSLHAATDGLRTTIAPVNASYPIAALIAACRGYTAQTGRVVTFEYVLLKGINDSADDALALASLVGVFPSKVNLIACNRTDPSGFGAPDRRTVERFTAVLRAKKVAVTVRASRGDDIDAACGQLRIDSLTERGARKNKRKII